MMRARNEDEKESEVFSIGTESFDKLEKTLGDQIRYVEVENANTGETFEGIVLTSGKKDIVFISTKKTRLN